MTRHLSSLALDALALDASPPDAELRSHLAACAACRARADEAERLRAQLPPYVMVRTLRVLQRRRQVALLARVAIPLVLAAAAVVLVLEARGEDPVAIRDVAPAFAIKGSAGLQIYALRDRRVFEIADGDALTAGDEIRFAVTPAGRGFVLIASVDGAGHATLYVPYDGERSAAIDPQGRSELPGSIVLDDAPGPERVFAVFSASSIEARDLWPALHRLAAAGPDALRHTARLELKVAAVQASRMFEKAVP